MPEPSLHSVEEEQPPAVPQASGLFIERTFGPEVGKWSASLHLIGDLRPTEVVSVLEMALSLARRQTS